MTSASASPAVFPASVVDAVLGHMNADHTDDNLVIVRAHAVPDATAATMTGFDGAGGDWSVAVGAERREVRLPWSVGITERAEVRREIVVLYDSAAAKLGLPPRSH